MPACNSCHKPFESFNELALHIAGSKIGHKKGKTWAAKYLLMNSLSARAKRQDYGERQPLTEEQKDTIEDCRREISGIVKPTNTICPKCKRQHLELLPIEYIEDYNIWKINDRLAKLCATCGGA